MELQPLTADYVERVRQCVLARIQTLTSTIQDHYDGKVSPWLIRATIDEARQCGLPDPDAEFNRLVLEGFVWLGVFYAGVDAFRESTFAKHIDAYLSRLGGESAGG